MTQLLLALFVFIGSHFLLSHPLRQPILKSLGERFFRVFYALVATATFIWVVIAYNEVPPVYLWERPAFFHPLTLALMLVAAILLTGSLIKPNPTLMRPAGPHGEGAAAPEQGEATRPHIPDQPKGVLAITRHPMMWAIALWGLSHALVTGEAATVLLGLGMAFLALAGAKLQEGRKRAELGAAWDDFARKTAFLPLGAQISGRLPWRTAWPGWLVLVCGISLYVILLYFHRALFEVPAVRIG